MKRLSLEKAIAKAGLTMLVPTEGNRITVLGKNNNYGVYHIQDESAVCVYTADNNDPSNAMIDYHAETFHKTIKSFIQELTGA